jgi:hypothetical protein
MPLIIDLSPWHGTLSFKDIQDEALGNDFGEEYRVRVKRWINEALSRIVRRSHLPEFELTLDVDTLAGDGELVLPSNDVRVLGLRTTDDQSPLASMDTAQVDEWPVSTGRPSAYSSFAGTITLYPVPDAAYSLEMRYIRDPELLVADDDTAEIPDAYVDALVAWARGKLFRSEDDMEAAQFWRGEFESTVAELRADLQRRDVSGVRQVPSMWAREPTPRFQFPS